MFRWALGTVLFWIGLNQAFSATDAEKILQELEQTYDSASTIEGRFEQIYRSLRFDEKKASGNLWISKPGKMRWDYTQPKGQVLVANGSTIILYDPKDQQALTYTQPKADAFPMGLSFLFGKSRLTESFQATLVEGKELVLRCQPKIPETNIKEVFLTLEKKKIQGKDSWVVVSTRILDFLGGENEIRLSKLVFGKPLADRLFEYRPPKGIPMVLMDSKKIGF